VNEKLSECLCLYKFICFRLFDCVSFTNIVLWTLLYIRSVIVITFFTFTDIQYTYSGLSLSAKCPYIAFISLFIVRENWCWKKLKKVYIVCGVVYTATILTLIDCL